METKPKIVFFGTPDFVLPVLDTLYKNFDLVGVVTQAPKPAGRDQTLTPSPVSEWASQRGIKIIDTQDPEKIKEELEVLNADLGVLEAYGTILPDYIINLLPFGIINVHPSLLPKYRGASPNQAAILNGDKQTGISVIKLDEKMDHGPILYQEETNLESDETLESLRQRQFKRSARILIEIIPDYIGGKITPKPQDDNQATFTWKTSESKDAAYFDIEKIPSQEKLDRLIRAFYPWPCAWTRWNNKIVKFYPGKQVQIEGKNKVPLEEFLRGYPNFPIKQLD